MADQINLFHDALDFGLEILSIADLQLKEKQYDVVNCVVLDNKDVLAVLPTGYGKSLIYQLPVLPPVFNFMAHGGKPEGKKSTVIVISPLNTLAAQHPNCEDEGRWCKCVFYEVIVRMTMMRYQLMCQPKYCAMVILILYLPILRCW